MNSENAKGKTTFRDFLEKDAIQSVIAALLCIILGLFIGYIALLIINPSGATEAIVTILKNYFTYPSSSAAMKYLGNTLVKAAPLLMCALSIQFCYQTGLFNIGAAGQYVAGAGAALYCALSLRLNWSICLLAALLAGGIFGTVVGILKAYLNVNEVISGIMLNWIGLYTVNMLLMGVKETASPYTVTVSSVNPGALLPSLGLGSLFTNNKYVTIAIPLSILFAILIKILLSKTVFGYEIKATGIAREAARYSGMKEKRNVILSLFIGGALAGVGAAFLFLSGYEQWSVTQSSVPGMGFNGIAATFLGGLDPIGTVFASYFIQHITSGGSYLDKNIYPSQISDFISAIIIYLCGFVLFFKLHFGGFLKKRREKAAAAEGGENK
ncbi:MAG: ABC transporter permease [Lachnospiraceae bacterium]|nr:ABC transporter permease [Lachnospiraceae bacterium]